MSIKKIVKNSFQETVLILLSAMLVTAAIVNLAKDPLMPSFFEDLDQYEHLNNIWFFV